jgi:protein phosphatase 2C
MGKGASSSEAGTRDHSAPLLEVLAAGDKQVNSVAQRRRLELRRLGRTASAAAEDEAAKRVRPVSDSSSDSSDSAKVAPEPLPPPHAEGAGAARVPACLSHGAASVIGRRREMEDAVAIAAPFLPAAAAEEEEGKSCAENDGGKLKDGEEGFFAVFDGHGGSRVAEACRERMHVVLAEEVERLRPGDCEDDQDGARWKEAMAACFKRVDGEVGGADEDTDEQTVGSTAVVAVVGPCRIVVANCGDSRAVLSRGGVAVPLSSDHKVHHTSHPFQTNPARSPDSIGDCKMITCQVFEIRINLVLRSIRLGTSPP